MTDASAVEPWAAVHETHSAAVFLAGDRAYKVKKPVVLDFLDFSTVERRRAVCEDEVELNRRLAPDVYLGVADVLDPAGTVCDHLVVMRRMPAAARLSTLIAAGADVSDPLRRTATLVAALHARSPRSDAADAAAGLDATAVRWRENSATIADVFGAEAVTDIDAMAARYLAGRRALFDARVHAGRAVDGHGDLVADDIFCLPDGPRILDCIEFTDRYRLGDGLSDVAFLAMDLERLGRPDLATELLATYREALGDAWPPSLAHHHIAYRAQVRARVGAVRTAQGDPAAPAYVHQLLGLCRSHLGAGRVRLVLVGGGPGVGKSTLASELGRRLDAVVLHSDVIRKELHGIAALESARAPFGEGIYDRESTESTYRCMVERAGIALGMGDTVVLDATWTDARWRREARAIAATTASDLSELHLVAPMSTHTKRLVERSRSQRDASDATPDIARVLVAERAPWAEASVIDASGPVEQTCAAAWAVLERAPNSWREP